ncbi:cupin domain-containing protein [Sansalvadorimonas verongulae]|uniref:hypothetical protein n=1 Tax=Sansalvadorimonas verongulae TaxID=2172824 RepID=UPI0012BB5592|nr:hypothetical protein [Sansalvadorimonas verongulae]MTI12249.1 hypothetical protein [Sansalvadorimonas verongulae]
MEITRLHTTLEGHSVLESVLLPMAPEDEQGHLAAMFPSTEVVFCETESNFTQDWHTAPRRQMVIVLYGKMEIELQDGIKQVLTAGETLLAEDTTGSGHITRAVGGTSLRTAIIPLA